MKACHLGAYMARFVIMISSVSELFPSVAKFSIALLKYIIKLELSPEGEVALVVVSVRSCQTARQSLAR